VASALVGRQGNRRLVVAADRAAREAGLRVGMPATKAQALVHGLAVMNAEPDADAEALERLALWALRRYAPIVAVDTPAGLVMDTTGADHLHGGERLMLAAYQLLIQRLQGSQNLIDGKYGSIVKPAQGWLVFHRMGVGCPGGEQRAFLATCKARMV